MAFLMYIVLRYIYSSSHQSRWPFVSHLQVPVVSLIIYIYIYFYGTAGLLYGPMLQNVSCVACIVNGDLCPVSHLLVFFILRHSTDSQQYAALHPARRSGRDGTGRPGVQGWNINVAYKQRQRQASVSGGEYLCKPIKDRVTTESKSHRNEQHFADSNCSSCGCSNRWVVTCNQSVSNPQTSQTG